MNGSLVERIKDRLGIGGSADEGQSIESDGGVSTTLYRCSDCETTYISEELQSCPECDEAVSRIPSEHELGFVPENHHDRAR